MSGFLGDLSPAQEQALKELKSRLPSGDPGDDYCLLRFLRARKFDVQKTFDMYIDFRKFRKDNNMDDPNFSKAPPVKADLMQKLYYSGIHGEEKEGGPLFIERLGAMPFSLAAQLVTPEEFGLFHAWEMEHLQHRCEELSKKHGKHVERWVNILDMTGLNASARKCIRFVQTCAEIDQNYYPEVLHKLIIINPPWIFPVLYKLAKPWLDPVVIAKIEVLRGPSTAAKLLEYIPKEHLPAEMGGECKCEGGCIPIYDIDKLQAELKMKADAEEEALTEAWVAAGKKHEVLLHAGAKGAFGWFFKTDAREINFSVFWKPANSEAKEEVVRATTRLSKDEGSFSCTEAGILRLEWDNGFSYLRGKTIRYSANFEQIANDEEEGKEEGKEKGKEEGKEPVKEEGKEPVKEEGKEASKAESPSEEPPSDGQKDNVE